MPSSLPLDDELACWCALRDVLRVAFIRCAESGRPFPPRRQRLLHRVEDQVAHLERLKRSAPPREFSLATRSQDPGASRPATNPAVTPHKEVR